MKQLVLLPDDQWIVVEIDLIYMDGACVFYDQVVVRFPINGLPINTAILRSFNPTIYKTRKVIFNKFIPIHYTTHPSLTQ